MSDVLFSIKREYEPWLSDEVLRESVLGGLQNYLEEEAIHLMNALHTNEFDPHPDGPNLIQALEEDADLKQYVSTLQSQRKPGNMGTDCG